MKVSYELKQGYIDIWNEENEEWDRYIKVNKKSVAKEEKKIPENNFTYIYSCEDEHIMANFENIKTTLKDIIDYLKSKGDE